MPAKLLHQMRAIKGLTRALNDSGRFKYKNPECVVDFAAILPGVVGLAVAQRLCQRFPSKSTYLLERHARAGEETSSRNSEVVHSGLYYPPESLKTSLCLRGRDLLYERCEKYHIPFKQTGKLVVATEDQRSYVEGLHAKSLKLKWPPHSPKSSQTDPVLLTKLLSKREIRELEPDLSENIVAALWSPKTGIIDSHSLMESLEKDILDSEGGELVFATDAVRVDRYQKSRSAAGEGGYAILARHLINASGLSSVMFLNSFLPTENRIPMFYARGSYASYHGPGVSNVSHLIYPCPQTGPNAHAFESLGTHLTLDLQGKIRFGPDIEWIDPPESNITGTEKDAEFWTRNLIPDDSRLPDIYQAVTSYLPGVALEGLQPDYVGIRPKLIPPGGGFQDFVIKADYPSVDAQRNHSNAMISLLGIESPGLTSSLAIAEMVVEDVLHNT
ncbi:pyridine nucleotide disulfide oxidoreductase-like protein [Gymnopilus junonius]|uniref:L-2-hydroxyglutarate dehydrogenase, mitochondrial n=1 Tax=Gymnopilus junonius TaxID=109634 RepID=A0A9P5P3K0_GYMJU|nr:pyridine nucleotide disulfide oxidoreductase-like protein [Gymnopilus junonius]